MVRHNKYATQIPFSVGPVEVRCAPSPMLGNVGSKGTTLTCFVKANPLPEVTWQLPNSTIVPDNYEDDYIMTTEMVTPLRYPCMIVWFDFMFE